tara:strand:+ start:2541 stop:3050 length:510 start_codon:yes stop_codon:yes gene_type:complete
MKTFAHLNSDNMIIGIGMIYQEDGRLTSGMLEFIKQSGLDTDSGIVLYGELVAPTGATTVLIDTTDMPGDDPDKYDKTFRSAYKKGSGLGVDVDMPIAKSMAHDKRRIKREKDIAPLDIKATIPNEAASAEASRQVIRDANASLQVDIDNASNEVALKELMVANYLIGL